MKAVSNASPLITLARAGRLDDLPRLFETIYISHEVYHEVVVAGAGLAGAAAVSRAEWIQVTPVEDQAAIGKSMLAAGLGAGEASAVQLARELGIDLVLMDERRGRRLAQEAGLAVVGCVGILEDLFRQGFVADLRQCYIDLLRQNIRIDLRTLQSSLATFQIPPL